MRYLDIETTGLDPFAPDAAILMAGWADGKTGKPVVLHLASKHADWRDRLHLIPTDKPIVGHNIKFDLKYLRRFGVRLKAAGDTMLVAQTVDENRRLSLKALMASEMGGDWTWEGAWDNSSPQDMARYLATDVLATRKLWRREYPKLTGAQRTLMQRVVIPALNHLVITELTGLHVPAAALEQATHTVDAMRDKLLTKLDKVIPPEDQWPAGLSPAWGATNWQRWFLFEHLGIKPAALGKPTKMFPQGAPSMSAEALVNVTHPIGKVVVDLAKVKKMKSGFLTPYATQLRKDKLYTTFNLAGTVTGRLSAGATQDENAPKRPRKTVGINVQQVPKDKIIKPVFQAPPGYVFMEADYSQLELRVAAVLAREQTMLQLYNDGEDIHTWMVGKLLHKITDITELERRTAKAVNFGFLYGMRAKHFKTLAKQQYGLDITEGDAERFRDMFFMAFPGIEPWHQRQIMRARMQGYVATLFGRRRHLPDITSSVFGLRSAAERQSINAPVQGTGSDIALYSYARLGARGDGWHCAGLVHDALLFYVKEAQAEAVAMQIKQEMERPLPAFDCPLAVDVVWGKHWGDHTHELD